MKKFNLIALALLLALLPGLQSCDDNDSYSLGDFAADWATVRVTGGDTYALMADNWGSLWPAATSIPGYRPVDGQRVLTFFNPLSDNTDGYDHFVKVEWIRNILTKQVEELVPENEEEYGNDPVLIYKGNMWIDGGYLNIIFRQNLPAKEKHRVSLVRVPSLIDDREDGYIRLELRYNTYGDITDYWRDGAVSFNLNSLELEGMKGIKLKLNSIENGEVEVTFDLKNQGMPESAKKAMLSEEMIEWVK